MVINTCMSKHIALGPFSGPEAKHPQPSSRPPGPTSLFLCAPRTQWQTGHGSALQAHEMWQPYSSVLFRDELALTQGFLLRGVSGSGSSCGAASQCHPTGCAARRRAGHTELPHLGDKERCESDASLLYPVCP